MWLMQVGPEFMHYVIRSRKACIVDSASAGVNAGTIWSHMAQDLVMEVMGRLNAWYIIVLTCKDVCAVFEEYAEEIGPGKEFPSGAFRRMGLLGAELSNRMRLQSYVLNQLLPNVAPLKYRYRNREERGSLRQSETPRMDPNEGMDRIAHLVNKIQGAIVQGHTNFYGLSFYFDMLDRELLAQGPASHVDKRMYDQLSDIMAMDEMLRIWMWNQLGYAKFETGRIKSAAEAHYETLSRFRDGGIKIEEGTFRRIGVLMRQFFETPFPKGRKDLEWLERASQSRARLSELWDILRKELRSAQIASGMDMNRSAIDTIFFDSEPDYLAELEEERGVCEQASKAREIAHLESLTASPPLHEDDGAGFRHVEGSAPIRRKRTKAKAARDASSSANGVEADMSSMNIQDEVSTDEEPPPNNTPILLSRDSMMVFERMFRAEDCNAGGVRWLPFVKAMEDVGFTARGTTGSEFSFSSEAGTIVLHKPHLAANPVVEPSLLRYWGRRLSRKFDWSIERFQLRKKE